MSIKNKEPVFNLDFAMPHPKSDRLAIAGLSAAVSCLAVGDILELELAINDAAGKGSDIAVCIAAWTGTDTSAEFEAQIKNAIRIAQPAYRFSQGTKRSQADHAFCWRIAETSDHATNGPLGFVARASEAAPRAALKQQGREPAERPISSATHGSADDVIGALISVGISARVLFSWFVEHLPEELMRECTQQESLRWLGRCKSCNRPVGLVQSILVSAADPLPPGLLSAIGHFGLGTDQFVVNRRRQGDSQQRDYVRVLKRIDDPLPALFPSPDLLIARGARRGFADAPPCLPKAGTTIGVLPGRKSKSKVRIPGNERSRHLYVVGATGTGKSTILLDMLLDDIRQGKGTMLLDPHGDLFDEVLSRIPRSRRKDLTILNAAESEAPFSMNVLSVPGMSGPRAATFITNELLAMFSAMYNMKNAGGPIFETYFTHSIALLMNSGLEAPTLADLARLFEDRAFLMERLDRCTQPYTYRFWKGTALKSSRDLSLENMSAYIASKVNRFVLDANLRPILATRSPGIDLRRMMDGRKIVLVNLAKGRIGAESARFLGMVFMMRLLAATLSRAAIPEGERRPFHVYVDEFQTLATSSAGTMLAEARKYGVCTTLASQSLGQLDSEGSKLADTVTANCGTMIMTRLGPDDAGRLARTFGPVLTPEEMQALPSFHAVGRFLARDIPPPPFVFAVSPPKKRRSRTQTMKNVLIPSLEQREMDAEAAMLPLETAIVPQDDTQGLTGLADKTGRRAA